MKERGTMTRSIDVEAELAEPGFVGQVGGRQAFLQRRR
jgi:hypothetical protein